MQSEVHNAETTVSLEVGVVYVTRDGRITKITATYDDTRYPYWCDMGFPYPKNGKYFGFPDFPVEQI